MVIRGVVQAGVVVLAEGARLPEGLQVAVVAEDESTRAGTLGRSHSALDIPVVSLGAPSIPLTAEDLLGEMLEGRS